MKVLIPARPEQVAETLRQVIAEALRARCATRASGFVTVTGVLVTHDLSHARVMVSVPGDEAERDRALEGLQSAAGFLRSRARPRRSPTRIVPELHFELDRGLAARRADQRAARRRSRAGGAELIGAVLVDKPAGLTSHDVVQRVRRVLGTGPWATRARWIRSPPACWWCWWGGRPGWRASSRRSPRPTSRPRGSASATDTDDLTGDGRWASRSTSRGLDEAASGWPWPDSSVRAAAAAARDTRPSTWTASAATGWRAAARPVEPAETTVTVHRIELVRCDAARASSSASR